MSGSTILVVYQDELYLGRVRAALAPAGYKVSEASTSTAAIAELQRSRPGIVVFCPCVTPEMHQTITQAVKELYPDLTVLRLSPNHVDKVSELLQ